MSPTRHPPCLACCSEEEDKPLLTKGLLEQKAGGQAGQSHVLKWMAADMGADDDEADGDAAQVGLVPPSSTLLAVASDVCLCMTACMTACACSGAVIAACQHVPSSLCCVCCCAG